MNNDYWCYIGTYTHPQNEIMTRDNVERSRGILVAPFDSRAGTFGPYRTAAEVHSPSYFAVDEKRKVLYAVEEGVPDDGSARVSAWQVDKSTGSLTFLNSRETGGGAPCHLAVHPSGKYLGAANYRGGDFVFWRLAPDGSLAEETERFRATGTGTNLRRQDKPHAHGVYFFDGRVYLVDLGTNKIYVRRMNEETGKLSPDPDFPELSFPDGAGPRHLARFENNGKIYLFACNELDSTVTGFALTDGTNGQSVEPLGSRFLLPEEYRGKVTDNKAEVDGKRFTLASTAGEIATGPGGSLLVSNRGHDSISVFAIDVKYDSGQEKTELRLRATIPTCGMNPRYFTMTPGGHLTACNMDGGSIFVFSVDPTGLPCEKPLSSLRAPFPVALSFWKK